MESKYRYTVLSLTAHTKKKRNSVFDNIIARKSNNSISVLFTSLLLIQALFIICLALLLVVGYTAYNGDHVSDGPSSVWGANVTIDGRVYSVLDWIDGQISPDNIKQNLFALTQRPHIAGSDENHRLAQMMYKQWNRFKFDKVELVNYSVLLSYPNASDPNSVQLLDAQGSLVYDAHTRQEPPLTPNEDDPSVAPPFNAYSGSGTVSGPLVYVNFGRIEDFLYLTETLKLDLSKSICIVRYGNIFRGDKARLAQRYGCLGLVIYSDPEQYAPDGVPVYPDGPGLPPGGVQRGSLLMRPGDPLTPELPAIEGMHRRTYSEAKANDIVPSIPVQPVSYGDIVHFMNQLTMYSPPNKDWIGKLKGIDYKIRQSSKNTNVTKLRVNNYQEQRTIYNLVATIYGAVEPDRQVILGNHRDAWVFGAVDPNSATAVLMEIARTLGVLRQNNWRPGRTLILCSWDAEEHMLVGSTEWVEDKGKLLASNTVAYINVDIAVEGNLFLKAQASPLLYTTLWEAAKMVKCPDTYYKNVYEQWRHYTFKNYNGTIQPNIFDLGSGTDYTAFLQQHGISCISMAYENRTDYDVYHSVHDNFYWMTHFGDPDFSSHSTVGLVWTKTAFLLSTSPLLPYDPRYFGIRVSEIFNDLAEQYYKALKEQNITLSYLNSSVVEFSSSTVFLWVRIQDIVSKGVLSGSTARIINDRYMNMERAFIYSLGLPGRDYFKHVVFAPSSVNSYGSSLFPGISDAIFAAIASNQEEDWNLVRRQIDILRNHLRYASMINNEPIALA